MTDDTKHLLSNPTNAQRIQESIEELNNGGGVEVDPAMFDTVDTSKEAVERVEKFCAEAERRRDIGSAQDHIIGLGLRDMILYASDLRILLSERDQLRREVEEARDKALKEAGEAAVPGRIVSDDDYSVGWVDGRRSAAKAIEALKARP